MNSFDPRPLSRRADLATQKIEYDADTASINRRTMAMNAAAQKKYQDQMAARTPARPTPAQEAAGKPKSWLASAMGGMRRRMIGGVRKQ